ncbi:type VI secretion system contractile sheath small subunit [Salmonella enterica subsp. indica]|uniref:Type VI secretion protein n=1 Tax=Salmonella enterica TaxID=28901 RepID=A0A701ZL99_SALER|nr:type VI secretion system contractile sheath small subunit [Salmonella enterica]HAC6576941.1 hypothetical protein [Salmonella enterica subsp. indica]HBC0059341.1 type VI secretion system contractile sheath small subunit [Salmonella enterica]HCL5302803.1 type VI secretion system contractile sheath small subunit [Salmonella enterica]
MSKTNTDSGSVAPRERISVKYTPKVAGVETDVELPLNLLITGNLKSSPCACVRPYGGHGGEADKARRF